MQNQLALVEDKLKQHTALHAPNVVTEEKICHGRGEHVRERLQPPKITAATSVTTTVTSPGPGIEAYHDEMNARVNPSAPTARATNNPAGG
jgi:hypothetical protein